MTHPAWRAAQARWNTLAPREQRLVRMAVLLLGLALVWVVLMAPALRTLRQSEAQQRSLQAQWQQMQGLRAQALALQAQPALNPDDAQRALQSSVSQVLGGAAQLSVAGDRATLSLRGVPAAALAQWLAQARVNARAVPTEARLQRSAAPAAGDTAAWDGTLVLSLPAR